MILPTWYLHLSKKKRAATIFVAISLLLFLTYKMRYQSILLTVLQNEAIYQKAKEDILVQKKLIAQTQSMQAELNTLMQKVATHQDSDLLFKLANQIGLSDIQFTSLDEKQAQAQINATWEKCLLLLQLLAKTPNNLSVHAIKVARVPNQTTMLMTLEMNQSDLNRALTKNTTPISSSENKAANPFVLHTGVSMLDALDLLELRWMGVLQNGNEKVAFLELPDHTVVDIVIGMTFSKEHWKLTAIQDKQVMIENPQGEKRVIEL